MAKLSVPAGGVGQTDSMLSVPTPETNSCSVMRFANGSDGDVAWMSTVNTFYGGLGAIFQWSRSLDSVGCVPYDHANAWSDHSTYLISPHLLDTFRNAFKDSERLHDAPAGPTEGPVWGTLRTQVGWRT